MLTISRYTDIAFGEDYSLFVFLSLTSNVFQQKIKLFQDSLRKVRKNNFWNLPRVSGVTFNLWCKK